MAIIILNPAIIVVQTVTGCRSGGVCYVVDRVPTIKNGPRDTKFEFPLGMRKYHSEYFSV